MSVVRDRYRVSERLLDFTSEAVCYCESVETANLLADRLISFRNARPIPGVETEILIERMYSYKDLPFDSQYDFLNTCDDYIITENGLVLGVFSLQEWDSMSDEERATYNALYEYFSAHPDELGF